MPAKPLADPVRNMPTPSVRDLRFAINRDSPYLLPTSTNSSKSKIFVPQPTESHSVRYNVCKPLSLPARRLTRRVREHAPAAGDALNSF